MTGLRNERRIAVRSRAQLSSLEQQQHYDLTLLNISLQGAGLLSLHVLPDNCRYTLETCMPGYEHSCDIKINGMICHQTKVQNNYLVGFEFTEPSEHDLLEIKAYSQFHKSYEI